MFQSIFEPPGEPGFTFVFFFLEGPQTGATKFEIIMEKKNPDKDAEIRDLDVHACFEPKRKYFSHMHI